MALFKIGLGPERRMDQFEFNIISSCNQFQNFQGFCHYFGTNAVAIENCNFV